MAKGETDNVMAMLDTIRFASKDNPISEIPLRVGRGKSNSTIVGFAAS